jgi:hypothetical protein
LPIKATGLRRGFSRSGGGTGNFIFSSVAYAPRAQENPPKWWVFLCYINHLILFPYVPLDPCSAYKI